ncbi:uroporphyrinogen-III synthase [Ectothiorhodospiraceae bacterium WFHF3C12]|nr:uroporphyrinogen-III synthase [Ectothiorhodospiraceae bacterium WFHF3C12]
MVYQRGAHPRSKELSGTKIMITRPQPYCAPLAAMLESAGANVVLAPMVRLLQPSEKAILNAIARTVEDFHLLVFASPAAAACGIAYLHTWGPIPARLLIGAIGPATAAVVKRWGYEVDIVGGAPYDSEAFLASFTSVGLGGWSVAIFRAQDGRNFLANMLRQRGARVTFVQAYRRGGPAYANQVRARRALCNGVDAVFISSAEAFRNLIDALTPRKACVLRRTPVIAGHHRIAAVVRNAGVQTVVVANGPSDAEMFTAAGQWLKSRSGLVSGSEV